MTREQCENQIIAKVKEIEKIVQKYNPGNAYLEINIINGSCSIFNEYWDTEKPIRVNGITIGKRRNDDELFT